MQWDFPLQCAVIIIIIIIIIISVVGTLKISSPNKSPAHIRYSTINYSYYAVL